MIALKDRITKLAKEKNTSLCQIEEKAGLSKGSISKWNTVKPSVDKVLRVAEILGCNVDSLLYFEEK